MKRIQDGYARRLAHGAAMKAHEVDRTCQHIARQTIGDSGLSGKTLLVTGDSITEGTGTTTKAWHAFLAEWFGCTVKNDGKSSTGLIRANGGTPGIYTRIDTWNATYGAFDAILIMGNMNDGGLGVSSFPVGSFTDAVATASQYGALHKTIQKLIAKYPNTPIGWIISTPRLANVTYPSPQNGKAWGSDSWFEPYCQAIIEVCEHYSIPYLDLYHASQMRPWDPNYNLDYFYSADGVHPNAIGHEIMAAKIFKFVGEYVLPKTDVPNNPTPTALTFELGTIAPVDNMLMYTSVVARARDTTFYPCTSGRFTIVDSTAHKIAVYACSAAQDDAYLHNNPAWAAYQEINTAGTTHVKIVLKKMSGVDFSTEELAAMNTFFTYTPK